MGEQAVKKIRVTRRTFLKGTAVAGTAAAVGMGLEQTDLRWLKPAGAEVDPGDQVFKQSCGPNCGGHTCPLLVTVRDGKVVKVEPQEPPEPEYRRVCLKGLSHVQRIYHPDRIKQPMKQTKERGDESGWVPISWEEALDTVAGKMKELSDNYGSRSIWINGGSGNYGILHGGFGGIARLNNLLQGTAPAGGIDTAVIQGINIVRGGGIFLPDSNEPADYVNSRLIVLWGNSMAEAGTQLAHFILDAMERGAKLYVIDPRYQTFAAKAHEWLRPLPGSDIGLAMGIIHVLINENLFDRDFVMNNTVAPFLVRDNNGKFLGDRQTYMVWDEAAGQAVPVNQAASPALLGTFEVDGVRCRTAMELLKEKTAEWTPEHTSEITSIPAEQIHQLAVDLGTIKPGGIIFGMGVDRYETGNTLGQGFATILGLTGAFGHSGDLNGFFFAGFGGLNPGWLYPAGFGSMAHSYPLVDFQDLIATGKPWPIKMLYSMCGNPLNQYTNRNKWLNECLPQLEMIVTADLFMTPTARLSDIVLPAAHYFETDDVVMGGTLPYFILREKAIEPMWEAKGDWWIESELAKRLGLGQYFEGSEIDQLKSFLDFAPLKDLGTTWDVLKANGMGRCLPKPFIPYQDGKFETQSTRIEFYNDSKLETGEEIIKFRWPLEAGPEGELAQKFPLVFNCQHGRFRVHSSYCEEPWMLELNPEPVLEMNPKDARDRGIADGDTARIYNDRGKLVTKVRYNEAIRPGMLNMQQGWWDEFYIEGHHQELTHAVANRNSLNLNFHDVRVEVEKV